MTEALIEIEELVKTFRSGLRRREVRAINGLTLTVGRGQVVALIGPNGAGKTSTIYLILGLLKAERGNISVFGRPPGAISSRQCIGYQSEIFYTYPFYTARRSLRFYGRLSGMTEGRLDEEIERQLTRVGLREAADRKVGTFSKGMIQRLGLAQALVHQPELLILDEPATGLDPEGRKLVAEIILEEKASGRTVFLSSHILSDVERTSDRVVMIRRGEVVFSQNIGPSSRHDAEWEVEVLGATSGVLSALAEQGFEVGEVRDGVAYYFCPAEKKRELLEAVLRHPVEVGTVRLRTVSLEDLYMRHVKDLPDA